VTNGLGGQDQKVMHQQEKEESKTDHIIPSQKQE
jgi:hypothetical protein